MNEKIIKIAYDENRLKAALLKSGISADSLKSYIDKASNSLKFYEYDKVEGMLDYDTIGSDILNKKYLMSDEKGPLQMWDRVARALAGVEKTKEKQQETYDSFMSILTDFKFIPGGRILHGAGREDVRRSPTLSNCYVIPQTWAYSHDKIAFTDKKTQTAILDAYKELKTYDEIVKTLRDLGHEDRVIAELIFSEDSIESIYQFLLESGKVYRSGGGVGTDDSGLRPKGSTVNSTISIAPGAPVFMNLKSENTETIAQADRRGALMITMRVDHPDVEDFISIKDGNRNYVKHANISVLITDEFMKAVEKDEDFTLKWTRRDMLSKQDGKIVEKKVKARELWDKIITHAHSSAEPGIIFWDTMKAYHNGEYFTKLTSTNPCGEQPLPAYGSCNLGNMNLGAYTISTANKIVFDFERFSKDVAIATRFMDNVIDYNNDNHALERIKLSVRNDRRIGLGLTGLADALIKLGIRYDSEEGLEIVAKIMETYRNSAYNASIELAKERGAFPKFEWDGFSKSKFVETLPEDIKNRIKINGIRNVTLLTVAPVGTGSIIAQTSSGIEPIFAVSYFRDVKDGNRGEIKKYEIMHPLIRKLFGKSSNLPSYVVPSHKIDPYFRVKIQGTIQKYVDSSISSTINLPEETTKETVAEIYSTAWKEGLKGITIYREGCREGVLNTIDTKDAKKNEVSTVTEQNATEQITKKIDKHPLLKEEPHSKTYSIQTGEGKLYITITGDENGFPQKTFINLGPVGTSKSTSASVDGIRLSRYLEEAKDPDLIQIFKDYSSAKSDNPKGLGPGRVDSIQHGFSVAWLYDTMTRGVVERINGQGVVQIVHKDRNKEENNTVKILKEEHNLSSLICSRCGSRNVTPPSGGCREPICQDCGYSTCG